MFWEAQVRKCWSSLNFTFNWGLNHWPGRLSTQPAAKQRHSGIRTWQASGMPGFPWLTTFLKNKVPMHSKRKELAPITQQHKTLTLYPDMGPWFLGSFCPLTLLLLRELFLSYPQDLCLCWIQDAGKKIKKDCLDRPVRYYLWVSWCLTRLYV